MSALEHRPDRAAEAVATAIRDLDIADIRRLRVEPGETLVVTTARPITTIHADRLCQALKLNLPPLVRVVVLDPGVTLQVVSGGAVADPTAPDLIGRADSRAAIAQAPGEAALSILAGQAPADPDTPAADGGGI